MSKLSDFKALHQRFQEAVEYITKNTDKLKAEGKWDKVMLNFQNKYETPLDAAWLELSYEEQRAVAPLYLVRKALQEPTVQKVIEVFDAKIVKVEPVKEV